MTSDLKYVGKKTPRVDGPPLARGKPVFTDDIDLPDLLYLKILRSPHAHARIKRIDPALALAMEGVQLVLTHRDFPPRYYTTAGQGYPEPSPRDTLVLGERVRYVGDRVAVVAADSLEIAVAALEAVQVEYETLPAVFDPWEALTGKIVIHPEEGASGIHDAGHNIASHLEAQVGNVEQALSQAAHVFEGRYQTPYAQQAHIEPHITITWLDENDRVVIRTSTQVPFHVRRIVAEVLDIPVSRIRVIKPRIGGGFGSKQEILMEELCAAVTLKTGRPARLELTREEEFYAARARHPQIIDLRLGLTKDYNFSALDITILENSGAYGTHSLTVMSVTALRTLSMYRVPHARARARAVYTNLPVAGAYRGYGGPQGCFALEVLLDEAAAGLGLDPLELRRRNLLEEGDSVPIATSLGEGQEGYPMIIHSTGFRRCLDEGAKLIGWADRPTKQEGTIRRGVGMAAATMGSGIAGIDMAAAYIKMNEDGSFNLLVGATDLGTGSDTALAQIAAEVLTVPVDKFLMYSSDTDFTPFDTGAYASSTTYVSGGAVKRAAEKVRRQILEHGKSLLGVDEASIDNGHVVAAGGRSISYSEICTRAFYTDDQRQIMATASHLSYDSPPPYNATFAEVTVDTESGLVRVERIVSVTDGGQIINPQMAAGQAEGAIPQSLGMCLSERMIFDDNGAPVNTDFNGYHIYTAIDMPELVVRFVESHEPTGPFGAKAVAEIPINAPAPAVVNAIFNACGVRLREIPVIPEQLLRGLRGE
ncbi:MAG: molybdopterin-dependent oxidoreductase [Candidatus Marinimicrobia bacterium]|nr:molybdopterin-dependent oxidoreductase [Candidatus Neomarinimicrobiota bacterium]